MIKYFLFLSFIMSFNLLANTGVVTGFDIPRFVSLKSEEANLRVGPSVVVVAIICCCLSRCARCEVSTVCRQNQSFVVLMPTAHTLVAIGVASTLALVCAWWVSPHVKPHPQHTVAGRRLAPPAALERAQSQPQRQFRFAPGVAVAVGVWANELESGKPPAVAPTIRSYGC